MDPIEVIAAELSGNPLGRGYSGMNDAEAAADMNIVYRTLDRISMTGSEVANAIDQTEFLALANADEAMVWNILHLGELNPFGIEANLMVSIFGVGSNTIIALLAARKTDVSRGVELGVGRVSAGQVAEARL